MLSPTFKNSPNSTSNFMVNEDESIPSPAQQLRKVQSATRNSPADSHRSAFSNRTQTGLIENDDIEDTDVLINGVPVENGDSALGADAALGADVAALGADDPQRRADPQERFLAQMSALGCSLQTLEAIVSNGVDASAMATLCHMQDHKTMQDELFIDSGLLRARIISKIHEIDSSQSAFSRPNKSISVPATISSYRSSREPLPSIPSGSQDGRLLPTVTKWRQYMVAIEGYLQLVGATGLAELCKTLFKTPTLFKQHHLQIRLNTIADKEADLKWANEILVKAQPIIQRHLSREENITWHTQRSGAMMVASLSLMIMNRTQEQDTEALASFMAWPSVPKAEQLQKGIIDMDDEMERLVDGGFDINAQLEAHVLGKLTKTIRAQDRHKFDLAMFWAQIPRNLCHTSKVTKMRALIQQCIADYPELKSNTAQMHAALARKIQDWVCFGHREYGICNKQARGHKCNFLHITPRPTTECTNAAYVAGNECSNFNKCKHTHPKSKRTIAANPANKPKTATNAMMSESLALNRTMRSNFGQDNRERYLDTTDYDDLLIADVPTTELDAALRDPVSSQSSETDFEGDTDQSLSDIENDIRERDAWGCADADYQLSSSSCESGPKQFSSYAVDFEKLFGDLGINDQPTPTTPDHLERMHAFDDDQLTDSGNHTQSSVDSQSTLTDPLTMGPLDCGNLDQESHLELPADAIAEESLGKATEPSGNALSYFGIEDGHELDQVELYTPPGTQETDLIRDARETSKSIIEPRQLFPDKATMAACSAKPTAVNGREPTTLVLLDSGSTRHMIGSSGLPYAHNLRQGSGTLVTGVTGVVDMDIECDVMLRNGSVLQDCLVNGDSELNICSERLVRTAGHNWKVESISHDLKQIKTAEGLGATCYNAGGLDYLPFELEPVAWCTGSPNEVINESIFVGIAGGKSFDWKQHELDGHYPRVHGCDVCARAFMQSLAAKRGGLGASTHKSAATLNIDLIDWGRPDNNNHRYSLTGVVTDAAFPTIRQLAGKTGAEASKAIRSMVAEIERVSSTGEWTYRVERIHKDQGSEFKSEHLEDCASGNVLSTTGEESRHTDCAVVEGFNKTIEHTATALALTALSNPDHAIDLHGELSRHGTKLIRLRSRTAFQKETGISAWREQTLTNPPTDEVQIRWGSLAYGFIKKEDRSHKLSQRAYAAIFVGTDDTILGAARLVPFILLKDGAVKLFKTKVTKTYQAFDGVYPLMLNKQCVYPDCADEWMLGDELLAIEATEATEEAGETHEVEKILGKNVYDTVTGACEYKCRFKGYSAEHDRWIDTEKLCCDELIAEYEAEQKEGQAEDVIAGCCAEDAANAVYQGCNCDFDGAQMCDDCDNLYNEVDQCEVRLAQVQEDFDAKIAFAYLHECSPLEVSTEMIRTTNGGVEAYEDLYLKINLEYDADGSDFTWVERVLAQEAPAPKIDFVAGAIGKNSVSDFVAGAIVENSVSDDVPEDDDGTDDDMPKMEKIDFVAGAIGKNSVSDFVAGAIVENSVSDDVPEDDDGTDDDMPKMEKIDFVAGAIGKNSVSDFVAGAIVENSVSDDDEILTSKFVMERADAMMCAAKAYRADCEKAATPAEMANVTEKMVTVTKGLARCGPPVQTELKPTVSNDGAKRGEVSIKEASKPEFAVKFKAAIDRELQEMGDKRFVKCPEPTEAEKATALEARFVLTVKDAETLDWKFKARLVGKDLKRLRFCDPEDSYAPVPCSKLFRLLMAGAGGKRVSSADLVTAYLQAKGFVNASDFIWIRFWHPIYGIWIYKKLSGYIYGCIEAGQVWGRTFADWMVNALGFTECKNNGSVYVLDFEGDTETPSATGADQPVLTGKIIVSTYVDDPIIVCDNEGLETWFHQMLEDRFDVKFHSFLTPETPLEYCGARLTLTNDGCIKIDNKKFIEVMLEERGLQDCNPSKNPITKHIMKQLNENADKKLDAAASTVFRSGLGQIHWLASTTHPKLSTAHSMLARYTANPVEGCLEALKAMCRYTAGCMEDCLMANNTIIEGLKVYSDSDWAGEYSVNGETASRTGCLITYNGMPVDWCSTKQLCIATSSADAESRALSTSIQRGLHTQYLAEELALHIEPTLPVYVDAAAAIGFARNNGGTSKMKHIDIRAAWVQQIRDKEQIKILKIAGTKNPADFFTKLLTNIEFDRASAGLASKL